MYESTVSGTGKVIGCISPCQQQGVSTFTALLSSFCSCKNKKTVVLANELRYDINATTILQEDKIDDGLSEIVALLSSYQVKTPEDITMYANSLSDTLDVIGCNSKERMMIGELPKVADNLFEFLRKAYDFVFIDFSSSSNNAELLEKCDVILYAIPESLELLKMFKAKEQPMFLPVLQNKPYLPIIPRYVEFGHMDTKKISRVIGEEVYTMEIDGLIDKLVCEKNIHQHIMDLFEKPKYKRKSAVFNELNQVYDVLASM